MKRFSRKNFYIASYLISLICLNSTYTYALKLIPVVGLFQIMDPGCLEFIKEKEENPSFKIIGQYRGLAAMGQLVEVKAEGTFTMKQGLNHALREAGLLEDSFIEAISKTDFTSSQLTGTWTRNENNITLNYEDEDGEENTRLIKLHQEENTLLEGEMSEDNKEWSHFILKRLH